MKIRRSTPRPPGANSPLQLAGVGTLLTILVAALVLAAATGKL